MASNTELNTGSGGDVTVTKERTHDGDAAKQQGVFISGVSGTEGSYTFVDVQAGAGTEANALRVTLPTDGTGVVILGAGAAAIGSVTVSSGAITETNSTAILADTAAIDTATAAINAKLVSGTVIGDVNLGATDNAVLDSIDAAVNGTLSVTATAGAAQFVDDAAFTVASSSVIVTGAVATPGDSVDSGDAGAVGMSLDRRLWADADMAIDGTSVTGGAGAVAAGTPRVTLASDDPAVTALQLIDNAVSGAGFNVTQLNGANVTMGNGVSGTGVQRVSLASDSTGNIATIGTSITPGTAGGNLGKAEDAAHATGHTGVMTLAVSAATPTATAGTAGDYQPLSVSSVDGRLFADTFNGILSGSTTAVTVPAAGLTTLATIASTGYHWLVFQAAVATQPLDDFNVSVKGHASAAYEDVTPADWTVLEDGGFFKMSNGNLAATAAGATAMFKMDITGFTSILVEVSSTTNNSSVTPRWTLQA